MIHRLVEGQHYMILGTRWGVEPGRCIRVSHRVQLDQGPTQIYTQHFEIFLCPKYVYHPIIKKLINHINHTHIKPQEKFPSTNKTRRVSLKDLNICLSLSAHIQN